MKIEDLTQEQRKEIEALEIGNRIIKAVDHADLVYVNQLGEECERTIKRIDSHLEDLEILVDITKYKFPRVYEEKFHQRKELIKQKQLYELMEQLE